MTDGLRYGQEPRLGLEPQISQQRALAAQLVAAVTALPRLRRAWDPDVEEPLEPWKDDPDPGAEELEDEGDTPVSLAVRQNPEEVSQEPYVYAVDDVAPEADLELVVENGRVRLRMLQEWPWPEGEVDMWAQSFVEAVRQAIEELLGPFAEELAAGLPSHGSRSRLGLLNMQDLVTRLCQDERWAELGRESVRKLASAVTNHWHLALPGGQIRKLAWLFKPRSTQGDVDQALLALARKMVNSAGGRQIQLADIARCALTSNSEALKTWGSGIKAENPKNTVLQRLKRLLHRYWEERAWRPGIDDPFEQWVGALMGGEHGGVRAGKGRGRL